MNLFLVHSTTDHPNLLKPMLERIEKFCDRFGSEADPNIFFEAIARSYFSETPDMLLFAAVQEGNIVAHALYTFENFYGHKYVNMMQYWVDEECKVSYQFKEMVFRDVAAWAKEIGTDDVRIWARNEEVADLFEKVYGFERSEKVIMDTSLKKVADRIAELPSAKAGEA